MKTGNILVIDDDAEIREIVQVLLSSEGYTVETVADGMQALTMLTEKTFLADVIILDIMMPDMDGYSVCKQIREISQVPIILITAKGEDYERVMGLDIGADDYIVKPFSPNEVMARVRAVLRRMGRGEEEKEKKVLTVGDLTINIEAYTVFVGTEKIPMTKKEVETMWILAGNPSKVFTRDNLLDSLWGQDYFGDSRTVDSHIKRLRAKLDKVPHPNWEIKTIWGLGYKFELTV